MESKTNRIGDLFPPARPCGMASRAVLIALFFLGIFLEAAKLQGEQRSEKQGRTGKDGDSRPTAMAPEPAARRAHHRRTDIEAHEIKRGGMALGILGH